MSDFPSLNDIQDDQAGAGASQPGLRVASDDVAEKLKKKMGSWPLSMPSTPWMRNMLVNLE